MSLVRMNRNFQGAGKRPKRSRKALAPKKEWVSTVSDLSVHKASPEELARRHEIHRSQNRVVAQWELQEKAQTLRRRKNQPLSPPGLDKARRDIIREVFSDQFQMRDVIARSDRALAVVKDLFGDAPRRRTGFPTVTAAPDCASDSELPFQQRADPPTQLSLLSQSMMDPQALNEFEECEELDEDARGPQRNRRECRTKHSGWGTDNPEQYLLRTPSYSEVKEQQGALNATVAVRRVHSRLSHSDANQSTSVFNQVLNPGPARSQPGETCRSTRANSGRSGHTSALNGSSMSTTGGNQSSLEFLQSMLEQVETEMDTLEQQSSDARPAQQKPGLTGFSVALVTTLGRLARHARNKEEEALREAQQRRQLEEEVKEQRALIDALTVETLTLREESAASQMRMQQQISELERRLNAVLVVTPDTIEACKMGQISDNRAQSDRMCGCEDVKERNSWESENHQLLQDCASAAVLLSPPRQRDGLHQTARQPASHSPPQHYSGFQAATASQVSLEDFDLSISPSSFASLPRPTSLLDSLSQGAVLGEIAELTRQNASVRAQLEHHRPSPAGASVSREQSADRPSTSSSDCRQASSSTEPPCTQQSFGVEGSSTLEIKQKLQELNRQSAEARGKLLQLIEQQKQISSLRASPAISPVPPHSDGMHKEGRDEK